jgi:hypothetical protein
MTIPAMRRGSDQVDDRRTAGRPRSTPRPMPEFPALGYAPYRAWGRLPAGELGWWVRLLDWAVGPDHHLLYIGITSRAGFVRWVEESDTWRWARDVSSVERDDDIRWPTLYDAVLDRAGAVVLVLDPTDPDGARPARPDDLLDPRRHPWRMRDGREVLAHEIHPRGRPARNLGKVIEGARTGERRMIQAEAPVHNTEHNEGNARAVNRVPHRRILARHVAAWRRSAAHLALAWLALAAVLTWALHDGAGVLAGLDAAADAVALAAVLILTVQLAGQATRGRTTVELHRRRVNRARRNSRR